MFDQATTIDELYAAYQYAIDQEERREITATSLQHRMQIHNLNLAPVHAAYERRLAELTGGASAPFTFDEWQTHYRLNRMAHFEDGTIDRSDME